MNIKITGNVNECFAGVEAFKKLCKNEILASTKKRKIIIILSFISFALTLLIFIISGIVKFTSPVLGVSLICLAFVFAFLSAFFFLQSIKLQTEATSSFIDIDEIIKRKTNEEYGSSLDIWDAVNSGTLLGIKTKSISDNAIIQNLEFSIKNIGNDFVRRISERYTIMLTADRAYSGLIVINVQNKTITHYFMDKIPQGNFYLISEQEKELTE